MKIRPFFELTGGVYKVSIYTEAWSEGDKNLMTRFGQPEIDLGGDFLVVSDVLFTLPNNLARIMSESPFSQSFDGADYESPSDAEIMAKLWQGEISLRITDAVSTLRSLQDDYTSETVETV